MSRSLALASKTNVIFMVATLLFIMLDFVAGMYVPSMSAIANNLHSTHNIIQLTMVSFMVGLGLSQLFSGSFSDRCGRKKTILLGLLVTTLGNLICVFAYVPWVLILGRLIQGLGMGFALVVSKAMLNDSFAENRSAKNKMTIVQALAYTSIAASFSPTISVWLGGYFTSWFNWHAIFIFLTAITALLFILILSLLPETNIVATKKISDKRFAFSDYKVLFKNPEYLNYTLSLSILTSGISIYYILSGFIFIKVFNIPAYHIGYFAFLTALGFILGKSLSNKLYEKLKMNQQIILSLLTTLSSGILIYIGYVAQIHSIWALLLPSVLYMFGVGLISPTINAKIMQLFPKKAGSAVALLAIITSFVTSLANLLVSYMNSTSILSLCFTFIGLTVLSSLLFLKNKIIQ